VAIVNRPSTSYRGIARWLVSTIIFAILARYLWQIRDQLAIVRHLDVKYLVPLILVPLASLGVNGWIARELAAEFDVRMSPVEWYGLAVVNSLGNYLPLPQAGAAARALYLKRVYNLPYATFAAMLFVTYVSAVALYGVLGVIGLCVIGRPAPLRLWAIFVILSGSLVLFTPAIRLMPLPKRFAGFQDQLRTLRSHHVLGRILLLQAMLVSLTSSGLWLACQTLPGGSAVTWPAALMMGLMILASGIVNLTPGNLGVEQAAAGWTASLLHIAAPIGFLASAIFRVVSLLTIVALGPFFAAALARRSNAVAK
jgi:uncharacterized membrane protein YbhN (UPF0104 family)